MKSTVHGIDTSPVEITNISAHGIWLFAHGKECFLAYSDFPWFKDQPVKVIFNVKEVSPNHFYWSDIDVDLTMKMIENPEQFPLKAK